MPDPTDPRAVADDPSGIVQQMPEVTTEALKPCPFCGNPPKIDNYGNGYYRIDHWCYDTVMDNFIAVEGERKSDVRTRWNRRATEADLRAEVDRLRALIGRKDAALREAADELDEYYRAEYPSDHPLHQKKRAFLFEANPARSAISPETDGGKDA